MKTLPVYVRAASAAALLVLGGSGAAFAQGPNFTGIGFLNNVQRESYVWGVSPNGQFVCGESSSDNSGGLTEAFTRSSEGFVPLGAMQSSNFLSVANGINDNLVTVGFSRYNTFGTLFQAFRSTGSQVTPEQAIGDLPGASMLSSAQAVSNDGNITVGYGTYADAAQVSRRQAFAYVAATAQMRGLGFLSGDNVSVAYGVSGDGTRVAGQSSNASSTRAIVWTLNPDTSITRTLLPDLPGGFAFGEAWGISGNGLVIVGDSESENGIEATKWVDGQPVALGDLPGGDFNSSANDASEDGSVIVGYGTSATSGFLGEAVYWDASGVHSIRDLLVAAGVDMTGWTLQVATGVSADGRTIVGNGTDPEGNPQGWIVVLGETTACAADFNNDGDVNPDDLGDFINCYFGNAANPGSCPGADFNGDNDPNPDDLGDYINAYFDATVNGC